MNATTDLGWPDEIGSAQQQQQEDTVSSSAAAAEPATEQPKQEPQAPRPAAKVIPMNERGLITPKDSGEEYRFARMLIDSNAVPKCFETELQVLLAVQMCRALGLEPSVSIRQIMVVPKSGTLALWGELPKAACEKHIAWFEEFPIDKDYARICYANKNLHAEVWGYVCTIRRKGENQLMHEGYFTIGMAETARLFGKDSPWKYYPDRMLQMRARSRALKDAFPDVLSGVAIAEYDHNMLDGRGTPSYHGQADAKGQALADEIAGMAG